MGKACVEAFFPGNVSSSFRTPQLSGIMVLEE
jgi:hypothetical protein